MLDQPHVAHFPFILEADAVTLTQSATPAALGNAQTKQNGNRTAESKLILTGLTKSLTFLGALSASSALRAIECNRTDCLNFRLIKSCSSQSLARYTASSSRGPWGIDQVSPLAIREPVRVFASLDARPEAGRDKRAHLPYIRTRSRQELTCLKQCSTVWVASWFRHSTLDSSMSGNKSLISPPSAIGTSVFEPVFDTAW